jgi:phenylpropionate dioxygenase-like ring-hydroxylating dioxygenase large terminal subunit
MSKGVKQRLDEFRMGGEEAYYKQVVKNIEELYHVVAFHEGVIEKGHIYKNPRWIVMEKSYNRLFYDTTFVIIYCEKGSQIKMSLQDYKKIQEFCTEHNEQVLLYVSDEKLKGHCRLPDNMDKINDILVPIYTKPDKQPMAWYQAVSFY